MSEEVSAAPEAAPEVVESNDTPEVSDLGGVAPEVSDAISADPEAAEAIADAVDSGEITEAEAVQMIKQLTLKVDGEEIIEDLPFEVTPEMAEYLKKELQMSKMSQKRAQEAAEAKKSLKSRESEMQEFLNNIKDDQFLENVIKELGHDPAEMLDKMLQREVEQMALSPEQRELAELKAEMARIKESEEAAKEAKAKADYQKMQDQYAADFERDLLGAMESGGLPNDPYTIQKMAGMMKVALTNKIDVSFADLVPLIKEEQQSIVRNALSGMSAEDVLQYINEKTVNDIVLKRAPKAKKEVPPTAASIKETGTTKKSKSNTTKRSESAEDFFTKMQRGF